MNSKISIIGLGWLGLPLYQHLSKLDFSCIGSTTTEAKKEDLVKQEINATLVRFLEQEVVGDIQLCLKDSEILVLNTPPGLRREPNSNYVAKIQQLIKHIEKSSIRKVLYISSTSVFKDSDVFAAVTNKTLPNAVSNAGIQIRKVEELLKSNSNFQTTILRFSGLVNDDRHPATMMSKRKSVKNPYAPVNLIHRKDCIGIITSIIQSNLWEQTYNASSPLRLTKKEYYDVVCSKKNISKPNFDENKPSKGKWINGEETASALNYKYKYLV